MLTLWTKTLSSHDRHASRWELGCQKPERYSSEQMAALSDSKSNGSRSYVPHPDKPRPMARSNKLSVVLRILRSSWVSTFWQHNKWAILLQTTSMVINDRA